MIKTAKRTLKKLIKGQKGQALPIVLILLVLGGLLIVPTLNYASTSLKGHQVVESKTLELYAADSGIEDSVYWLPQLEPEKSIGPWDWQVDHWTRGTYEINKRDVDVTIEEVDTQTYKITSIATSDDGSSTTIESYVTIFTMIEGDFTLDEGTITGNVYVEGDLVIDEGTITGNVYVEGDLVIDEGTITGNVIVEGDLVIDEGTINDDVCVGGDLVIDEGTIHGDAYVGGDVNQPSGVTGSIYPYEGCPLSIMGGTNILSWEIS